MVTQHRMSKTSTNVILTHMMMSQNVMSSFMSWNVPLMNTSICGTLAATEMKGSHVMSSVMSLTVKTLV